MMSTVTKTRLSKLKCLVQSSSQAAVATKLKVQPAYVNQLMLGKRGIGSKTARKIEEAFGKPEGWMDNAGVINIQQPQPTPALIAGMRIDTAEAQLLHFYENLSALGQAELLVYANKLYSAENVERSTANPFGTKSKI